VYFRLLLIGYFEGIDSERACLATVDLLALPAVVGYALTTRPADHSTTQPAPAA